MPSITGLPSHLRPQSPQRFSKRKMWIPPAGRFHRHHQPHHPLPVERDLLHWKFVLACLMESSTCTRPPRSNSRITSAVTADSTTVLRVPLQKPTLLVMVGSIPKRSRNKNSVRRRRRHHRIVPQVWTTMTTLAPLLLQRPIYWGPYRLAFLQALFVPTRILPHPHYLLLQASILRILLLQWI